MITIKHGTGINIRGPKLSDADFALSKTDRLVIISSESTVVRNVNDLSYTDHTTATTDTEYDINVSETVAGTLDNGGQLVNLDTDIANLSGTTVTRIKDGTARLRYNSRWISKGFDLSMNRTNSSNATVYNGFVTTSFGQVVSDYINSQLSGNLNIYQGSPTTFGSFTLNSSRWCVNIDLSCFSPWNTYGLNQMGGTLISPRHVLYNAHFVPVVGSSYGTRTIYFVAQDGEIVTRQLINTIGDYSLGTDLAVCVLDSDVPSKIKFAKVLPSTFRNKLAFTAQSIPEGRLPIIKMHQNKHATIGNLCILNPSDIFAQSAFAPNSFPQYSFYEQVINGDSSSGAYIAMPNGEIIVLGGWRFGGPGGFTNMSNSDNQAMINSWMTTLGGGYQLTTVDLSGFTTY